MSVYKYNFASVDFNNENTKFTFKLDSVNLISPVYFSDSYLFKKRDQLHMLFLARYGPEILRRAKKNLEEGGRGTILLLMFDY